MTLAFISNPTITFIKLLAIIYVCFIYCYAGVLLTIPIDRYILYPLYDRNDEELAKKSTQRHIFEATIILTVFSVFAYIGRNILQEIPFPLDGVNGFKYMQVKEVASGALLLWIFINVSPVIINKLKILRIRFAF